MKMETDPNGKQSKEPGAKLDAGKPALYQGLLSYFPRACESIASISTLGAVKYSWKGWETVPRGFERYSDAMVRHLTREGLGELTDADSGCLHAAHTAWNALARLELLLQSHNTSLVNTTDHKFDPNKLIYADPTKRPSTIDTKLEQPWYSHNSSMEIEHDYNRKLSNREPDGPIGWTADRLLGKQQFEYLPDAVYPTSVDKACCKIDGDTIADRAGMECCVARSNNTLSPK